MAQRLGSLSRVVFYEEATWDSDTGITTGYILPVSAQESFGTNRDLTPAPVYTGDRQPRGAIQGMINAAGDIPLGLEFTTVGRILKVFMGPDGYSRVGSLHQYGIGKPGSCQLEKVSTETPPIYIRDKGVLINTMAFTTQAAGVGTYTMNAMGSGTEAYATLDASPTDDGYVAADYFNGYILKNGTALGTATAFTLTLGNALNRQDTLFHAGIAAGINPGLFTIEGSLGLIFEDLDYYNEAVNFDTVSLECFWSNAPLALATQWLRMIIPAVKLSRATPRMGGEAGITVEQNFRGQKATAAQAAEIVFPTPETYNIPSPSNLGVKVAGGATVTKALTTGTARTATEIVTDLQATGGIAGTTISVFNGRPRIVATSLTDTLQIDTAVSNSAHALFGLDGTVRSGYGLDAIRVELQNALSADY